MNEKLKVLFQDKRNALDWIRKMSDKDGDMLLLYLDQLDILLNQEELPFSVLQSLVALLTDNRVRGSDRTDRIYKSVLNSKFLRHPRNLKSYILKLSDVKTSNSDTINEFAAVVNLMEEIVDRVSEISYTDLPLDALNTASQKLQSVDISK